MSYFKLIRMVILGFKLIPILFFPYYFISTEIGIYGVLLGYIYTLIYLGGFEFWFKYNREFVKLATNKEREKLIAKQNQKYLFNYLFVIPIFIFLFSKYNIEVIIYSFIILISYHLTQEINRILIHLEDHTNASLLQLYQTLWVLLLPLGFISNIYELFRYISIFSFFALVMSILTLYKKHKVKYNIIFSIDFDYTDYKEISFIMLSALLIKFFFFLPRFILEWENQLNFAGIFTYFQSISMVSEYFMYFFIQAIFIPKLLKDNRNKKLIQLFKKQMIIGAISLFFLVSIGMNILFNYILKDPIYGEYINIAYIILVSVLIIAYSSFYTSINYVNHDDKSYKFAIVYSSFVAFPIFILSEILIDGNLLFTTAISFLLYACIVLVFRIFYAKNYL